MSDTKAKYEAVLDTVRRALAKAATAAAILDAGKDLPALITTLDAACDAIDDAIAAEAESIDRTRANALRADRTALDDLVTDAQHLQRRIEDKHKAALSEETAVEMSAMHKSALSKQAEAKAIVANLGAMLQQLITAFKAYEARTAEIGVINDKLRAAGRNELCVRSPLHSVTRDGEKLGRVFDFLQGGRLLMPGESGPNLLDVAIRLKSEGADK